ncbi:multidrug ABC transporter ATP-binding protein [Clostridium sp. chh4-2]|uniref:ABC transporter ATP-binding protein n=1 Tax=Clostridium sp. chh4-2 TaxID=2067550 RepID=UPI000CCEBFEF|nr:ABC transporter ATP-binding protein [Clostridium sp. chh4-2]PNV64059.1 multidrug ABC transporter ATP-binding protein [Clostridium sp. chh4-2]
MEPIISLDQVSKSFSGRCVLSNVSLNIEKGSTVGIVGANGSGKSVLFNIICGFLTPDRGQVRVRGQILGKGRDFPENMGVLINAPGFISLNTGLQNLRYLAGIRGVAGDREIRRAMQKVGLDPEDKTKVEHYSLGMKQKLGIAQAIMENQDILILDEPFNALDYKTYNDTKEIIRILQAEGRTILMTSHNYDDLETLCTHIYAMDEGKLDILSGEEMKRRFRG